MSDEVEERLVEENVSSLAALGAWIVTAVQYFAEQETRGGRRQKLYVETTEAI